MNVSKANYTKAGLMLYLNDISFSFVAELFERKEVKRKYKLIFEGNYQRIDLSVLKNICEFLNVTPGVILDGIANNDIEKVYIKNINTWIDFDVYILLRSNGILEDAFKKEGKMIEHNVSFKKVSEALYNRNGINGLIRIATSLFTMIVDPKEIKTGELGNYCHNKEKYFHLIKPYLLKFMDEKTFEIKIIGVKKILEQQT